MVYPMGNTDRALEDEMLERARHNKERKGKSSIRKQDGMERALKNFLKKFEECLREKCLNEVIVKTLLLDMLTGMRESGDDSFPDLVVKVQDVEDLIRKELSADSWMPNL